MTQLLTQYFDLDPSDNNQDLLARHLLHSKYQHSLFSSVYLLPCFAKDDKMYILMSNNGTRLGALGGKIVTTHSPDLGETPDVSIKQALNRLVYEKSKRKINLEDIWDTDSLAFHITPSRSLFIFATIPESCKIAEEVINSSELSEIETSIPKYHIDIIYRLRRYLTRVAQSIFLKRAFIGLESLNRTLLEHLHHIKKEYPTQINFSTFQLEDYCKWFWLSSFRVPCETNCGKHHQIEKKPVTSYDQPISFDVNFYEPESSLQFIAVNELKHLSTNVYFPQNFLKLDTLESWRNFLENQPKQFLKDVSFLVRKNLCKNKYCTDYDCPSSHFYRQQDCPNGLRCSDPWCFAAKIHPIHCSKEVNEGQCTIFKCKGFHLVDRKLDCAFGPDCDILDCDKTFCHPKDFHFRPLACDIEPENFPFRCSTWRPQPIDCPAGNNPCELGHPPECKRYAGNECTYFGCTFRHLKHRTPDCPTGRGCAYDACELIHPPNCPHQTYNECTYFGCKYRHLKYRTPDCSTGRGCAYDTCELNHPPNCPYQTYKECTYFRCTFRHLKHRTPDCPTGQKCADESCELIHPPTCSHDSSCHNSRCTFRHFKPRVLECPLRQWCNDIPCELTHPPSCAHEKTDICTYFRCTFRHLKYRTPDCSLGRYCIKVSCKMNHPPYCKKKNTCKYFMCAFRHLESRTPDCPNGKSCKKQCCSLLHPNASSYDNQSETTQTPHRVLCPFENASRQCEYFGCGFLHRDK